MDKVKFNQMVIDLDVDFLYHLGIDTSLNLGELFGDVKTVFFTARVRDAKLIANHCMKIMYNIKEDSFNLKPLFKQERFHLYKVKSIIIIAYGIGGPSLSICLNEIAKLLYHAQVFDAHFIKISSVTGIGVKLGSLCFNQDYVFASDFKAKFEMVECGNKLSYDTYIAPRAKQNIESIKLHPAFKDINLVVGNVMDTNDFYSGQLRDNGVIPSIVGVDQKSDYVAKLIHNNIVAFDLDSSVFVIFCNRLDYNYTNLGIVKYDLLDGDRLIVDKDFDHVLISTISAFIS